MEHCSSTPLAFRPPHFLSYILRKNDSCSDHASSLCSFLHSLILPGTAAVFRYSVVSPELSPYSRLAAIMGGAGISHGRGGAGKLFCFLVCFKRRISRSHTLTDNFPTRKHLLQRTHRFAQGLYHPHHQTRHLHHRSRRVREHGLQRSRTSRARAGKSGCRDAAAAGGGGAASYGTWYALFFPLSMMKRVKWVHMWMDGLLMMGWNRWCCECIRAVAGRREDGEKGGGPVAPGFFCVSGSLEGCD